MAGLSCRLCVIVPPGSTEAAVGRVQERLFSEHGLVSAPCLPPLMPLAFLGDREPAAGMLRQVSRSVPAGWRIEVQGFQWVEGHLFARATSGGAWQRLRAAAEAAFERPASPGLFPVFEGFYLGCSEAAPEARHGIAPSIPALSFTSATLALVTVQHAPAPDWWSDLHWEITEEFPFRGRRIA